MTQAKYIETFAGYDYFRDEHGNVYAKIGDEIMFCSNHKRGQLTEDKAEPSCPSAFAYTRASRKSPTRRLRP